MIYTYKDFQNRILIPNDKIPKIVFRTGRYKVDEIPKEVREMYEKEMSYNPDYTLYYFDNSDVDNFVILEYGIIMFDYMNQLIPKAFQADFWRYLVLYKYGGIYLDFTMHTLVPFDEILKEHKEVYVRDTCDLCGIYNAFIAVRPNAELIGKAIDKVIDNIKNKYKGVNALDVTGPTMFGRIFKHELKLNFYDWIPLGDLGNGIYLYSNPTNEYIYDGDKHIIRNRLDNHYELAYNEKLHPLVPEMKPLNHYSRLWAEDKIFKN